MNRKVLQKVLPLMMVVLMVSQMTRSFRWMLQMGMGDVYGLPADIVLVLTILDAVLTGYVTFRMLENMDDVFWMLSSEGAMCRNVFITVMVIDLLIVVFQKATELA